MKSTYSPRLQYLTCSTIIFIYLFIVYLTTLTSVQIMQCLVTGYQLTVRAPRKLPPLISQARIIPIHNTYHRVLFIPAGNWLKLTCCLLSAAFVVTRVETADLRQTDGLLQNEKKNPAIQHLAVSAYLHPDIETESFCQRNSYPH